MNLFQTTFIGFLILTVSCVPATLPTGSTDSARQTAVTEAAVQGTLTPTAEPEAYRQKRLAMVEDTIVARGIRNPDVIRAMQTVPRHAFVLEKYLEQAYDDHPLPIGYGQTISQPYIVAWMTELLELETGDKVLEIGTGSGYQAAILAELGFVEVFSIEIVPELAQSAADRLAQLGYSSVKVRQADGYYGWSDYAPFDAIIVTAAPDHLPAPLAQQLTSDGNLVIPIGPPGGYQDMWRFVNVEDGLQAFSLGGVAFVPFTGEGVEAGP